MKKIDSSEIHEYHRHKGHIWEREVFTISSDQFRRPYYQPWKHAIEHAIAFQKNIQWDPKKPKTSMSQELFACVQSYLPPQLADGLHLFCAIGTSLDWYHGVDGFFLIDRTLVTIDLSCVKKKQIKANVLVPMKQANIRLWRIGLQIANVFKSKIP